jgi:hypothetical protein
VNVQIVDEVKEKFEGVKEYVVFAVAVCTVISFIGKRVGNTEETPVEGTVDTTSKQKDIRK